MTKNLGSFDRGLRLVLAVVFAFLAWSGTLVGNVGVAAYVVAVVLLLTSLIGWCPAYLPFGLSTCRAR